MISRLPKTTNISANKKRRLITKKSENDDKPESSEEDTKEELAFLRENDIYQERTRTKKKSRYSLALGELRDRKQRLQSFNGEAGPMDHFCHGSTQNLYSDSDQDILYEDETDSEEGYDGFIVDDDIIDGERLDEAEISNAVLPEEFSMNSMQKLSYNFRLFVEYLLNSIHDKDFDTKDNTYNTAIRAIERRVKSYRDSVLTSDAWNIPFKSALDNYVKWTWKGFSDTFVECSACRGRKPANSDVSLSNCLHSREPKQVIFSVGSGCYKRGKAYHGLTHFRLHMYHRIEEEMRRIINSSPEIALEEDTLVAKVLKTMDNSGFVTDIYNNMKALFASADGNYLGEPDSEPEN
ncbi:hypothetical protein J3Q64DRAFT_1737593 [Phycomyces blakesleeanus]|uniref:DUF4211 domain-containing protein n=1 Tax=Phycomyces blakesleeanus TaxID=4837 RepID=A0ABR3B2P6_PHYBL